MSFLQEIEDGASGTDMPITTLLRKCLVLGSKLGSQMTVDWVKWELDGYPTSDAVPDYRVLPLTVKATLRDYTKQVDGWPVPPAMLGKRADELTIYHYPHGIGTIVQILEGKSDTIGFDMGNLPLYLKAQKFTQMEILNAWAETDIGKVRNILETVRTRVLMFALELSKEFPTAGEVRSNQSKDQERVTQIFNNTIYGSANVVGTATASNITLNVSHGDFASLTQTLSSHGVSPPDIKELKEALDDEPEAKSGKFGPKVASWIGGMITKAAEGTWNMATGAAG